ncbi:hypothetical protein DPMN_019492 [Dreissena polymorpha]|uniref:Uncharacterized protein n=1 Tax=Dreissena polymorpha TaxID=45954 RepID=A0A9D4NJC6_DREPO|nr:hypothetical protein DPMN_019492 [Dreissena polymorpha]
MDNIVQAVSETETDYFCSSQLPVASRHNSGPPESPRIGQTVWFTMFSFKQQR